MDSKVTENCSIAANPSSQQAVLQSNLPPLPEIPRWHLQEFPSQNPRDLQEDQLKFLTELLDTEIEHHNHTRVKLQKYLGRGLVHERSSCADQATVRYLNFVVHDLRTQIDVEKMKRIALEEEKQVLVLQAEMERELCDVPDIAPFSCGSRVRIVPIRI